MSVVDFGTNPVSGFTLAYHVTETIFTQLSYGTTDTERSSFEIISGSDLLTEAEREYTYYDLSVGFNLLPGESFVWDETAFNSAFYATVGIGSTDFAGDQRYTYTLGLGYKFLFTDWLAMHVEVKDHVFDIDILGEDKTTHNINYTIGLTAFF
jgi:outer membrane beta-barrel protein